MPWIIKDSSDSDDNASSSTTRAKLFGRQRSLHSIFGGGRVADYILWRNKQLSGAILAVVTLIWFLFEVVEYHFLTLISHCFITTMLVIFIWCNAAPLFGSVTGLRLIPLPVVVLWNLLHAQQFNFD